MIEERIENLPRSMQERAIFAREAYIKNPEESQVDDNLLIWMFDAEDEYWYSIAGNYSSSSPNEKRKKEVEWKFKREQKEQEVRMEADEYYEKVLYYSTIRKKVLKRDKETCQICKKKKPSKLHVHHILKRKENGSDCLDNLITVCPSCHAKADRSEYNPEW